MRRWGLACGLAAMLIVDGALWSGAFARGDVYAAQLALYPERLDGAEIVLTLVDVLELRPDAYVVKDGRWIYTVQGDPTGLAPGDEIYVGGRFHCDPCDAREGAEGRGLVESWREPAPDRFAKKVLGFLGMGLMALGAPLWFRVRRDGVALHG